MNPEDQGPARGGAPGISRRHFLNHAGALGALAGLGAAGLRARAAPLSQIKVGVALVAPAAEVGWTRQTVLAVEAVRAAFGSRAVVDVIENVFEPQDAERVFRGFAASGHHLVVGTSFSHSVPITRVARQFPQVIFDCCAGVTMGANLANFEARYHEGTFLGGVAAARMSKTGKLGFIGGYPVPDIVGPANAFLLGAQSVNPAATCSIIFMNSWEDPGKEKDATLALIAKGCDVLAAMTDSPVAAQTAEQKGVWSIGYASDVRKYAPTRLLTSMILDWSGIYLQDTRDVLAGTWKPQTRWWGLKEGVVQMSPYGAAVPQAVRALVDDREAAIKAGRLQPFGGEIRDQAGVVRVPAGTVLNEKESRSINWLAAGMQGSLKS
ncbi:MAG TPA: BMP family ABC transporter substrate-binding protein [Steroidobacteraceae bacterium]|nr:BMP family ABC transporter substrate-binding protein [Steroidobacteraceae bacterium]